MGGKAIKESMITEEDLEKGRQEAKTRRIEHNEKGIKNFQEKEITRETMRIEFFKLLRNIARKYDGFPNDFQKSLNIKEYNLQYSKRIADIFLDKVYRPLVEDNQFTDKAMDVIIPNILEVWKEDNNKSLGEVSKEYREIFEQSYIKRKMEYLHAMIDFNTELLLLRQEFPLYTKDFDLERWKEEFYD